MPCKSDCQPIFGVTQFVTQFKRVKRYFGALGGKQNKTFRKKCFDNMISKMVLILCKLLRKIYFVKFDFKGVYFGRYAHCDAIYTCS